MASFRLEPGLQIELIAAEPLVIDPVAFAFDEQGFMYVAENRGYPDPAEGGAPTKKGRIARLEDRDGDGRYDHRTEFATGLTYPNGIMVWRGGVVVTCAPDIYYFKDTNGDGIADVKKVLLSGFNADKTAQIRISHPTLGMDGWIYLTSGLNGGKVCSPEHPERDPVAFSPSDGRFHPETLEYQTTGGRSQFGLTFDAFGRRFGTSNRHPLQHVVIEPWYLERNPHLLFNRTVKDVAPAESEGTVYPISQAVTTADFIPRLMGLSHKGTFTSACGPVIFNGTALDEQHVGNAFICEPAQNLVQRQILVPESVSFRSAPAYENREFLSATDSWFNPVFLANGPGGALYLADMHRKVIDHPSYVPGDARKDLDFESGKDKGRIYRITRKEFIDSSSLQSNPFTSLTAKQDLVNLLASPNEWERSTAHRLLLEKMDQSTIPFLWDMATSGMRPEGRARALWLLYDLKALDGRLLQEAIRDREVGVREQAVLLSGKLLGKFPELIQPLMAAILDEEIRARYLSVLELGSMSGQEVIGNLARVAAKDADDPWFRAAVLSGIGDELPAFLDSFRKQSGASGPAFSLMMQDLGELFGHAAQMADCQLLLEEMLDSGGELRWRMATVLGLLKGLEAGDVSTVDGGLVDALLSDSSSRLKVAKVRAFIEQVARLATDTEEPLAEREVATAVLGFVPFHWVSKDLQSLLQARQPVDIQLEAVKSLGRMENPEAGRLLLAAETWPAYTPRMKSAVISAMVSRTPTVLQLFTAIEESVVAPAEIPSVIRQRLMNEDDDSVNRQARRLFNGLEAGGRMAVYQEFLEILDKPADPALGKAVFNNSCSSCHSYAGTGGDVGPDLSGVKNQPPDALLLHILVPNYEVLPAYQATAVRTADGRSFSGWIAAESENSITLRTAFGTDESILRSNIETIHHSGLSLMPDGLEQTMKGDDLANLIAFLKSGGL